MSERSTRRIVVTGLGLVTPLGTGVEKTWAALCAGQSGIGRITKFDPAAYDAQIALEKAIPLALKKAKPGTVEFRTALRDSMETMGRTIFSHGVMNWTKDDHWGYTNETAVVLKVVDGKFKVE